RLSLRISIGPKERESLVVDDRDFPLVPTETVPITVLASSTDFLFGDEPGVPTFEGILYLPPSGPARTDPHLGQGDDHLVVQLLVPSRNGSAQGRINYYYRDALIQSQLLTAAVGSAAGGVKVVTDYTASKDFTGLERIPDRDRFSILLNDTP